MAVITGLEHSCNSSGSSYRERERGGGGRK